ncbi:MAG TPA: CpaF family protein [Alphaproteobacteria bacterium]|jgi:pilus assembly protein CpaF|nr:CpaF family protein [Alphaproteobacteria bacterium]
MFGRGSDSRLQERINSVAARQSASPQSQPIATEEIPPSAPEVDDDDAYDRVMALLQLSVEARIDPLAAAQGPRDELILATEQVVTQLADQHAIRLGGGLRRALATAFVDERAAPAKALRPAARSNVVALSPRANIEEAVPRIYPLVMEKIDSEVATRLTRQEFSHQLSGVVAEVLAELKIQLNRREQRELIDVLLNDMLGLGPLEPLLADESVNDIMVNGAKQIYVERRGKLELTDATFRDNGHVMSVVTRIVSGIGRRIDESTPLVDARLADGSRVNIIIPPLAIDGPSISIRKFAKKTIDLDVMARQRNISPAMATVLKIASRCQLNILISGGTGSGKTTLLNAMSQMIDTDERIVTIEDAAELQLQQPHVVRLETRPPNLEGRGEITMRDLVKNALRMRPDRIILGEIRGAEAIDMLQAMNTGHDGSLGTLHANRPREALTRLENMVGMSGINLPSHAVRTQIAGAVHMILQVSRMRDGVRRVTSITEITGIEGSEIATQELFRYRFEGEGSDGMLIGHFESAGLRPHFAPRAEYYGLSELLMQAVG